MKGLREKFRNKKGFTLVEMLIVVAIIAILIAISIPLVSNALDRAKHATDAANERSAKAEVLICYLADGTVPGGVTFTTGKTYFYDAVNGTIAENGTSIKPYGKHKTHTTMVITVKVATDGQVFLGWEEPKAAATDLTANSGDLCSAAKDVAHST